MKIFLHIILLFGVSYLHSQTNSKLQFYDLDDAPMESNWAIAKYEWEPKGKRPSKSILSDP